MASTEQEEFQEKITQHVLGQKAVIDHILNGASASAKNPPVTIMLGPAGTGKTAALKAYADRMAAQKLADRFKSIVIMRPISDGQTKQLTDKMIDDSGAIPAGRKEEAKALVREMIDQGAYEPEKGLRGLKPLIAAIAAVSPEPDMCEALGAKYPVFVQRISENSGKRLAESFENGTTGKTSARKPLKFKPQPKSGRVGFFPLN